MLTRIRSWLSGVMSRKRLERELADELSFHIQARTDDLVRRGLAREEAARQARLEFGAAERYKEECRESRGLRLLDELRGDFLYAARGLHRSPGFAAVVVLSLALGIGANTAMFSVVNGVLLRPLPYKDHDRLVAVQEEMPRRAYSSLKDFRMLPFVNALLRREEIRSFEEVLAMDRALYQLTDVAEPEELLAGWVTANFCSFLGVQPAIGRCFTSEEEAGRAPVTVLSYGLWQRQFGGAPGVLGRSISLSTSEGNKRFTVIGVLPAQFNLIFKSGLWMPLSESANYRNRNASWNPDVVIAKLKPGVEIGQAPAELMAMQRRMFPKEHAGVGGREIVVLPVSDYLTQKVKAGLAVLLGVVALVLLITCANVANLLLSRDAGRIREIAVRESLGAGRSRICRQLLTEALTLATAGGVIGLIAAHWIVKGVKALAYARLPRVDEVSMDWNVLAFTALVSVASGMLFGVIPALRLSRVDLVETMKASGAAAIKGRRQQRVMNGLVIFEVALCAVTMMATGLLINTFVRLKGIDLGFRSDRLLVASLNRHSDSSFYSDVLQRVRSMSGVEAVALTNYPPPYRIRSIQDFRRPVTADVFGPGGPRANARVVSPGYFRAMGIPMVRGRDFNERDTANSRRVIVISEGLSRRYWPDEDPIGKTVFLREYRKEVAADIVGVVRDVRQAGIREPEGQMYSSYSQTDVPGGQTLVVRTKGDPLDLIEVVKREVRALDRNQAFRLLTTMEALLADEVAEPRFYMLVLGGYGLLAFMVTALGIGGLVAYSVSRRTREIGLRISFGATRSDLLRMFASGNLKLVVAGVVVGLPASSAVTRYARSLLYEVTPADPTTAGLVVVLLASVSLAASAIAALRATTVEPASVLRHE